MFNLSIPNISDEELKRRYKQIKPVVTINGTLYYLREFTFEELGISYLWNRSIDARNEVQEDELEIMDGRDFYCLHSYGYYGIFKTTIKEVLSQISRYDLDFVKAFEAIEIPLTANDFYKNSFTSIAFENGYHVFTVRLYKGKH